MREQALHVIGAILVTIIAVLGVLAACHMLISLPIPDGKGPEWVGAIGTIAAFAGTIWIATSESRARRRDAIDVAVLVCLEICHDVGWLRSQLSIVDELNNADPVGTRESWKGIANALSKRAQWPDEKLAKLICVGQNTAERMALVKSNIASGTTHLRVFAALMGTSFPSDARKKCIEDLQRAQNHLDQAMVAMIKFVELHRPDSPESANT